MEKHQFRIRRHNTKKREVATEDCFEITSGPGERITYGLDYIYKKFDPALSFITGCRTGHCGLCSMMINGKAGLACLESIGDDTVIGPLKNLPAIKDLVIDREVVLKRLMKRIRRTATLCGIEPSRISSKRNQKLNTILEKTNCILCLCCLSACPLERNTARSYYLPFEFLLLDMLGIREIKNKNKVKSAFTKMGLMDCLDCKECQKVCPKDIKIYDKIIAPIKNYLSL